MTLDELFPRSEFPLRARTFISAAGTDKKISYSIFYQHPGSIRTQLAGIFLYCPDSDNTASLAIKKLSTDSDSDIELYLGKTEGLKKITEKKAEVWAEDNGIAAGIEIDFDDPDEIIKFRWEQF